MLLHCHRQLIWYNIDIKYWYYSSTCSDSPLYLRQEPIDKYFAYRIAGNFRGALIFAVRHAYTKIKSAKIKFLTLQRQNSIKKS